MSQGVVETRGRGRLPARTGAFMILMAITVAAIACVARLIAGDSRWGFAAFGLLMTSIVALPFLSPRQRILSLWGLVAFVVGIGMGVRGLMISVGYPDVRTVDTVFLLGSTFDELYSAAIQSLGVALATTIGYIAIAMRSAPVSATDHPHLSRIRLSNLSDGSVFLIVIGYQIIGLLGTRSYSRGVGGLAAPISDRRTVIGGSGPFQSHGIAEYLASFGSVASVFLLAVWLARHKRLGAARITLLVVSFALGFSINLVTTTRADLVYTGAAALAVYVVIRGRLPLLLVAGFGLLALIGVGALTSERQGDAEAQLGIGYSVQSALLNRNAADISKTLKIVAATPDVLPYQYGRTIVTAAPPYSTIPRFAWPEKPVVTPGPIVGKILYGLPRTGVPPGVTAELVWNFGPVAVLAGVVLGGLLGVAERRFYPSDPTALGVVIFYALVVLPLGKDVFGVSIGQALSAALQASIPIAGIWAVAALRAQAILKRERRSALRCREGESLGQTAGPKPS